MCPREPMQLSQKDTQLKRAPPLITWQQPSSIRGVARYQPKASNTGNNCHVIPPQTPTSTQSDTYCRGQCLPWESLMEERGTLGLVPVQALPDIALCHAVIQQQSARLTSEKCGAQFSQAAWQSQACANLLYSPGPCRPCIGNFLRSIMTHPA